MNTLDSKTMIKKKLAFLIYADFETILVPEDKGKQNPNESYEQISKTYCLMLRLQINIC